MSHVLCDFLCLMSYVLCLNLFLPAVLQRCAAWTAVCTVCASPVGACARLGGVAHAATCRTATHAAQSTACAPTERASAPTAGTASTAPSRVS